MTLGSTSAGARDRGRGRAGPSGRRVLDACCGTGDLTVEATARGRRVTGLDFSERMLGVLGGILRDDWVQGDALALPFEDGSFDAATVGFGVRNLDDLERGLRELRRVLRPGGRSAILEITRRAGAGAVLPLWFDGLVPLLGQGVARRLRVHVSPASVRRFPGPEELAGCCARPVRGRALRLRRRDRRAAHRGGTREPGDDPRARRARRVPRRSSRSG
jgi:demethylmenaquinone methyltransferase/2-methoxy-6-polyprenyl-1,4-benzoquinol methylase